MKPGTDSRPVIVILGEEIPPCTGGVAQWGYWLARKFEERGLKVVYAARDDYARPAEYYENRFTVQPISSRNWRHHKDLYIAGTLLTLWRRWRPRAIICLNCKVARIPLLLRPLTGWKVAVLAHGMEVTKKSNHLRRRLGLRWVFGSSDLTVAVSRYTRERVLEFGVKPAHVRVLPCGVEPDLFRPDEGARVRARLGLEGRPVVLTLSRLVQRKGHDLVIRALAEVRRRIPDAVYLLAGKGNPAYVDYLRGLAESAGLGDAVRFLGYVGDEDLPGLYAASDVYVMASRTLEGDSNYEGFGITYLEANACGVPVIGADSGGVADAIVDGVTGFLIPPDDVPALADRLHRLLSDPDLARQMGAAGRARVLRDLTWDRVSDRFLEALEEQTGRLLPAIPALRPVED
jgi:phosphatidylinositol alpha-1,6-mannosyltransferase